MRIPRLNRPARAGARAFTLIELMIVLVIIAVLGAVVGLNFVGAGERARVQTTETQMRIIRQALQQYRVTYSSYPDTTSGLQILVSEKMLQDLPKDSWGKEFDYYSPTANQPSGYELISYGGDGLPGTADDIRMEPENE
ncbi:MAG: type II secretion system protein GspG [Planctomycetota bacterium]|nr:type II secretion system protein GspG [Planctomycetota bacterium]